MIITYFQNKSLGELMIPKAKDRINHQGKKLLFSLIVMIFLSGIIYSQGIEFIALSSKGNNKIVRSSKEVNLIAGDKIYENDILRINNNSFVNLVYKDGHTLNINSPGQYSTKKLIELAGQQKSSVNKKFANFVLAQFVQTENDLNNMHTLGEVVRSGISSIDYAVPQSTNYIDSLVTFNWYPSAKNNTYIFKLIGEPDITLYMKECNDTSITFNLDNLNLHRGTLYKWMIYTSDMKFASDTNDFVWLPLSKVFEIKDSLDLLNKDLGDIDSSLKQIILASFYSRNNLNIDMIKSYERAVVLDPQNIDYKKLLENVYYRLGLIRKALEINSQLQ